MVGQRDTIGGFKFEAKHWKNRGTMGSHRGTVGFSTLAGCGGLLRGYSRRLIKGYFKKIETCDVFHGEIWGMYTAHLILESDLKFMVDRTT
ncbi:hypothetical protein MTR_8g039850 [Medicago truncatula]|uniref:Uncharacterized protein n=1 Tax=Medicago truncatula TaxID=3880 RepID=G7LGU1_MEDTR|nr:hypothetical protein MTR_8g039850 [Medicago truncatula]